MAEPVKFDARLKEGIAYFEEMLKVMPDDRTTLEFLAVVYPQLGEKEKAEKAIASLARVLLKEGDTAAAEALLPQLEACEGAEAKAMALKVHAAAAPRPDLSPEAPKADARGTFSAACTSEAALAEELGEPAVAEHIRALPESENPYLVSALATIEKEHPEILEKMIARVADKYGFVPIPLDVFEVDKDLAKRVPEVLMKVRGVMPFAKLGELVLVVILSPHDAELRRAVSDAIGAPVRFYLAEPAAVRAAIKKVYPDGEQQKKDA